jgi:hypothetical protein
VSAPASQAVTPMTSLGVRGGRRASRTADRIARAPRRWHEGMAGGRPPAGTRPDPREDRPACVVAAHVGAVVGERRHIGTGCRVGSPPALACSCVGRLGGSLPLLPPPRPTPHGTCPFAHVAAPSSQPEPAANVGSRDRDSAAALRRRRPRPVRAHRDTAPRTRDISGD